MNMSGWSKKISRGGSPEGRTWVQLPSQSHRGKNIDPISSEMNDHGVFGSHLGIKKPSGYVIP